MCGITGIYNYADHAVDATVLTRMLNAIRHRGPDDSTQHMGRNYGLGFNRLSIVDLVNGSQPFFNDDKSVVLICNGEIFNYKELRAQLIAKGHRFKTACDIEVILYLYLEHGIHFLNKLNGQFAFAIIDQRNNQLFLARDQFGICPLFYFKKGGSLMFASEIKALLENPLVKSNTRVNHRGLDQMLSLPALVSPETMFENIHSLKPGHFLSVTESKVDEVEYWDLDYPLKDGGYEIRPESFYKEKVEELLLQSVKYRLQADVPVGFYLSGGLDSSLIGSMARSVSQQEEIHSFSIGFPGPKNRYIDESGFQQLMARHIRSNHKQIDFLWDDFEEKLGDVIYHSESPVKETYNVCSMALSAGVRENNFKVVLSGEGSDELFGGYAGYKFDGNRALQPNRNLEDFYEEEISYGLWGNSTFIYDQRQYQLNETKRALYSQSLLDSYADFDCANRSIVSKNRLVGRDDFHIRSYLDMKIRLAGHLISDHGDRMTFANSVEGRYPFLDINLVEFVKQIPIQYMLKGMNEKHLLKEVAAKYLPQAIINREKFGFVSPGSPDLMLNKREWVNDIISYDTIKRQGYFDPDAIEQIKRQYQSEDFLLTPPYDLDVLMIVLSFGIFLEKFRLS
jgi:asparagine synthase (glutamine-hydrolysing)